jgi:hypothetical protein
MRPISVKYFLRFLADYFLRCFGYALKWLVEVGKMDVRNGDMVKVRTYGGEVAVRRVIEVQGQSVIVSTNEEYETAKGEQREPVCIGFPLADVIEVVDKKPYLD